MTVREREAIKKIHLDKGTKQLTSYQKQLKQESRVTFNQIFSLKKSAKKSIPNKTAL